MHEASTTHDRLDSWKEIAAYIGRDIRTAMRWENERGLPIHRVPGNGARRPVFAYKDELDEWLEQAKNGPAIATTGPQLKTAESVLSSHPLAVADNRMGDGHSDWKRVLLSGVISLGLIVAAIITTIVWHHSRPGDPRLMMRIELAVNAVRAFDNAGHVLWTHYFPKPIHSEVLKRPELAESLVRIADLYGDGRREALVTVPIEQSADPRTPGLVEIDCFSNDGKLLWSYLPHEKFRFGSFDVDGPWFVEDVFLSQGAKPVIWAALTNNWGNSFVVQIDSSTGKHTVRFVNTGIIYKLNEVEILDKRYLLIGGFNNEYAAGILAAVDEKKTYAVSPQTAETRHKCVSCGGGAPDYYFVFPRSEINRLYRAWEDSVRFINVHNSMIEVGKSALGDAALAADQDVGKVYVVYDFQIMPDLRPSAFRFDSWYDMAHRNLQVAGRLDHGIESCPERQHPKPIRLWMPNGGWSEIALGQTLP